MRFRNWLLAPVLAETFNIKRRLKEMADKFDSLVAEVAANTSVTQSAIALIDGFIARFDEAKDDPEQIASLVGDLRTSRSALADAITRGTPSEEPPVEG